MHFILVELIILCTITACPVLAVVCAGLAQLVEQLICNHQVVSSIPAAGISFKQSIFCFTF